MNAIIVFALTAFLPACSMANSDTTGNNGGQHAHTNTLIHSSSPYLKQHAHNPVDWQEFSNAAWEEARKTDKMVLVSVGYSACHWCHVMEHESFEDEATAAYMNEHFVCIKVDREERPDVDQVYMDAVQLMNKRGGWPLNCFTLPDGRPIFGGTYFPNARWMDVLRHLVDLKREHPEQMLDYAEKVTAAVEGEAAAGKQKSHAKMLDGLHGEVDRWSGGWDIHWGGMRSAPKFPVPVNLEFLVDWTDYSGDKMARDFVEVTLNKMEAGGLQDHVGGGFARYSTDAGWHVPHFEKMLYDNAQLLGLYARAALKWGDDAPPTWRRAVERTIAFSSRELLREDGAFYSALDADSEGVEGKFYVWTEEELKATLTIPEWAAFKMAYDIGGRSLWEHEQNCLARWAGLPGVADAMSMSDEALGRLMDGALDKLLEVRAGRVRPGLDDKALTSWNALMVTGLCQAGAALESMEAGAGGDAFELALGAGNFMLAQRDENGGIYHSHHATTGPRIEGFLEDYAGAGRAFLDLYQVTLDTQWLLASEALAEQAVADFLDTATGGFWFTAAGAEPLFVRKQQNDDSVVPSAGAQMAHLLHDLGLALGRPRWVELADKALAAQQSQAYSLSRAALWGQLVLKRTTPFREVVISGGEPQQQRHAARELYARKGHAAVLVGHIEGPPDATPLLENKASEILTFYVCQEGACNLPVYSIGEALEQWN